MGRVRRGCDIKLSGIVIEVKSVNYPQVTARAIHSSVGADLALSINNTDDEIGPTTVTLSEAKGLSRWALRCFAALSMTVEG
jgi:hypothetical protein